MSDTITETVTFDDLISSYGPELEELEAAYNGAVEYATDEYGEERTEWPNEVRSLVEMYNEAGKSIQQRQHVLERLSTHYGDGGFKIAMLTGSELMDIETEMRMKAKDRGVQVSELQAYRQQLTTDYATVGAPEEFPTDSDGSPQPSEAPNPLTLSLYEHVERLNMGGSSDFRAPGFGDSTGSVDLPMSVDPKQSNETFVISEGSEESTRSSGNS